MTDILRQQLIQHPFRHEWQIGNNTAAIALGLGRSTVTDTITPGVAAIRAISGTGKEGTLSGSMATAPDQVAMSADPTLFTNVLDYSGSDLDIHSKGPNLMEFPIGSLYKDDNGNVYTVLDRMPTPKYTSAEKISIAGVAKELTPRSQVFYLVQKSSSNFESTTTVILTSSQLDQLEPNNPKAQWVKPRLIPLGVKDLGELGYTSS